MTNIEESEGHSSTDQPKPSIELHLTPAPEEAVVFTYEPDGRLRLSFSGRTDIIFPAQLAAKSFLQPADGGTINSPYPPAQRRLETNLRRYKLSKLQKAVNKHPQTPQNCL